MFYSSVILNSTETGCLSMQTRIKFYSSVILNSTETSNDWIQVQGGFYSSVILNSTARGTITRRRSEG